MYRVAAAFAIALGAVATCGVASATAPSPSVKSVSVEGHSCLITTAGDAYCWGPNTHGQVGDGTNIDRASPVRVKGLGAKVTSIAAGFGNTCATLVGGAVKCWGSNEDGQLGNGTTADSTLPVPVAGLSSGWTSVVTGNHFACARNTGGMAKCWGSNWTGQLGAGSKIDMSATPLTVKGMTGGVAQLAAGAFHACALSTSGGLKCWGSNDTGTLGSGPSVTDTWVPVQVSGMTSGVASVAADPSTQHMCAVLKTGAAKCWGHNYKGQVGNGTASYGVMLPTQVLGLKSGVTGIAVGYTTTCAIKAGRVFCWGNGEDGGLGTGELFDSHTPRATKVLTSAVTQLNTGFGGCAVMTQQVYCWGYAGRSDGIFSLVPKPVTF